MNLRKARVLLLRLSAIPFIFLAVFVEPSWQRGTQAAFFVGLVGYLLLLAGLTIRTWSILYIGGRKSRQLVTDGPYSLCRNPLYVGTLVMVIGAGLCFENILMLAAIIVVFVPVHLIAVRLEERHLESRFPSDYPRYKQMVPRFLPALRNYRREEELTVSFRSIRRNLVDTIAVLLIPQVQVLLEILHARGVIPVIWHFP